MAKTTTIVVSKKVKDELAGFKQYPRETLEEVIGRLMHIVREEDESELELNDEVKKKLARAEEDYRKGRFYTSKQIRRELGL